MGVTPERVRAERQRLAAEAEAAQAAAEQATARVQRLEAVLAFEVRWCASWPAIINAGWAMVL